MLLTGKLVDAATAAEWGLINHVVPAAELESATRELALKSLRPAALRSLSASRPTTRRSTGPAPSVRVCERVMTVNALAHDAQEGISAFLEKRIACWSGE